MNRTMKLSCPLTDEMLLGWSQNLARAIAKKRSLEEEKKETAKDYKEKINEETSRIDQLQHEISTRSYLAEVEVCEKQEGKQMITIRLDTDTIVSRRKLTPSELQTELDLDSPTEPEDSEEADGTQQGPKKTAAKKTRVKKTNSREIREAQTQTRDPVKWPASRRGATKKTSRRTDAWDAAEKAAQRSEE